MLLKFKWPALPIFLNLTTWIWMERQPPSDSYLIFMRREDLMNYPNVCTDLYLRLSDQETNCSVMRGIHAGSEWALNVILGSIQTLPFKTGGQGSWILWRGASVTLDISHWPPFRACSLEAVRAVGVVDRSAAKVQIDRNAQNTSLLPSHWHKC